MKKVIIIISIILFCVIACITYKTICDIQHRNNTIEDVEEWVQAHRESIYSKEVLILHDEVELMEDATFQEFVIKHIQEMYKNKEFELLREFLCVFTDHKNPQTHSFIFDTVTNAFRELPLEDALEASSYLEFLDCFKSEVTFTRDSEMISSYIEENGINPITTTPGEGYYANEQDSDSEKTTGIEGSSLHNSFSKTYMGDFFYSSSSGVKLNKYYEEETYYHSSYFFRGTPLSIDLFDFELCEFVWSGDYLFCFSKDGLLIDATLITD